jgi:hypothetical protein
LSLVKRVSHLRSEPDGHGACFFNKYTIPKGWVQVKTDSHEYEARRVFRCVFSTPSEQHIFKNTAPQTTRALRYDGRNQSKKEAKQQKT